MRIAILGATSQIAKDLIISFSADEAKHFHLFARRKNDVTKWLNDLGLSGRCQIDDFSIFGTQEFDAILNFVGVGNPAQAAAMGSSIFDVTLQYDELALNYVRQYSDCRYIFLSSGAAYGSSFDAPVDAQTKAVIPINNLQPQDWYGAAKLHAECRHRALTNLSIVDIRVFNYFSRSQNLESRFFISEIVNAIINKYILTVDSESMVRDYLHPQDLCSLIKLIIDSSSINTTVDCYSKSPVIKEDLINFMQEKYGLKVEFKKSASFINATGNKPNYFSINHSAAEIFGYQPKFSSIEGIDMEVGAILRGREFERN